LQQSSHATELLKSARDAFRSGNYSQAATLLLASTNEHERLLGADSTEVLDGLEMLGDAYCGMSQFEDAATTYQRAIEIKEKQDEPHYLSIAELLVKVAKCYEQAGNPDVAQYCYDQALNLCELRLTPKHPYVAEVLANYAHLLNSTGADPAKMHAYERLVQQLTGRNPADPGESAEPHEPINLTPHAPKLRAKDFKQSTVKQMAIDEVQGVLRDKWMILAAVVVVAVVLWISYMIRVTAMHSSLPH